MSLPELCIKRPVFTVMVVVLPVVLGLIALRGIGVDLFPNVELPVVIVSTSRPGASVEEMETGVTKEIEESINTISGIEELRSTTTEGLSVVTAQFVLAKDRDVAQQEVQSKVNTVISKLPTGTETPIIDKFDVDAAPVMTVAVSGKRGLRELTEIAEKQIKDNLSSLSGVGSVNVVGGRRRAVNVTVDTKKLEAYGLSIEDVRLALANQNVELPGGRVDQDRRELVLRTMGRVERPEQFGDIIVANIGGQPVRVRDLGGAGVVEDGYEEPRSVARLNGDNAVSLVVQKQSGTNTVEVIDTVKARLAELQEAFRREGKSDIQMQVVRDQSRFIKASLHEVQVHLVLGAFLVVLTILAFLRDWRTTVIAGIAIPVSIIATFPVMWLFDLTLNNITLIALVLVIGIVIDDAVIVIENIFRWMEEEGMPPYQAALKGTQEITLAVVATTLSLVVIFLPIAFMSGTVGLFLRSFGITCAISIMVSLLVSMTLTPMLSSRFLKKPKEKAGHGHHSGGLYGWLVEKPYMLSLRWAMRHRWAVILATVVVTASIFPIRPLKWPGLIMMVGFDFIPKDDQSEFEIAVTTPEGWSLQKTDDVFGQIERRLRAMPEVTHVLSDIGDTTGRSAKGEGPVTKGGIYVKLVELGERNPEFSQFKVMDDVREMLKDYPDLRISVQLPAAVSAGQANADVEFQLVGPDLDRLQEYAAKIIDRLRATPGLVDVDTTMSLRKPELRVRVDRERASDLGVSIQSVASTLRTLVGGRIVSDFKDAEMGEQYDVWLRAVGTDRDDPDAVANLTVPSAKAGLVPLGNLATPAEGLGPSQIDRAQRLRKISIIANLRGMPTGAASAAFYDAFKALDAPPSYSLLPTGRAKNQAESVGAFFLAFLLSLVFMYMILAAQFESFVHPITILLAVPLTVPFALLSLIFLGQPLTLFSVLGLFLLFGIVKKNGILQVDYTNVLRQRAEENPEVVPAPYGGAGGGGQASRWQRWVGRMPAEKRVRLWAILEANRVRLRPILMTTLMLITAMIPIALGQGPGAGNRADMAKVIVGGQALSLLLSLLVTPVPEPELLNTLPAEVTLVLNTPMVFPPNPGQSQELFCRDAAELRDRLGSSGTIVFMPDCDRLSAVKVRTLVEDATREMARVYRRQLDRGLKLYINNRRVEPFDPTYQMKSARHNRVPELEGREKSSRLVNRWSVPIQASEGNPALTYKADVRLYFLPISDWSELPKTVLKNALKVFDVGGVSFMRGDREVDTKSMQGIVGKRGTRDSWWRIEVDFPAELDEAFGVAMNKQGVRPKDYVQAAIRETILDDLRNVRKAIEQHWSERASQDTKSSLSEAEQRANETEALQATLLPQPPSPKTADEQKVLDDNLKMLAVTLKREGETDEQAFERVKTSHFVTTFKHDEDAAFYRVDFKLGKVILTLNMAHPFFDKVYKPLAAVAKKAAETTNGEEENPIDSALVEECSQVLINLQLFLLSLGRTQSEMVAADVSGERQKMFDTLRKQWSINLETQLTAG